MKTTDLFTIMAIGAAAIMLLSKRNKATAAEQPKRQIRDIESLRIDRNKVPAKIELDPNGRFNDLINK